MFILSYPLLFSPNLIFIFYMYIFFCLSTFSTSKSPVLVNRFYQISYMAYVHERFSIGFPTGQTKVRLLTRLSTVLWFCFILFILFYSLSSSSLGGTLWHGMDSSFLPKSQYGTSLVIIVSSLSISCEKLGRAVGSSLQHSVINSYLLFIMRWH